MQCPRDGAALIVEHVHDIEVDHCPECNGRWLDHHQLDLLEAVRAPDPAVREAMVQYARRQSELACPECGNTMTAFNYRAYNLELDTCDEEHGFWLDAGEEGRVHDIIDERVRGLQRAASAEAAWDDFLRGVGNKGVWDSITSFFRGRGRGR